MLATCHEVIALCMLRQIRLSLLVYLRRLEVHGQIAKMFATVILFMESNLL